MTYCQARSVIRIAVAHGVVRAGHVAGGFHAGQFAEVELRQVRQEELVARGVEDEFGRVRRSRYS